jgi:hypothetical protein
MTGGVVSLFRGRQAHSKCGNERFDVGLVDLAAAGEDVLQLLGVGLPHAFFERVGRLVLVGFERGEVLGGFLVPGRESVVLISVSQCSSPLLNIRTSLSFQLSDDNTHENATITVRSFTTATLDSSRIGCWCSFCMV